MALGIVLLLLSVVVFVILIMIILPKLLLKINYFVEMPDDRGLKRYIYKGKHCIVYESGEDNKRIIKQYILLEDKDCKILRCKTAKPIKFINYDVVVYDKADQIIKIINVKENLVNCEYTRRVELPQKTSFVKLVIKEVDNEVINDEPLVAVPNSKIALYAIISAIVTAFEVFIVKICCAYAFGGVFRESFIRSSNGTIVTLLLGAVMGVFALIAVIKGINKYKLQ